MRALGHAHTPAYLEVLVRLLPFVGGERLQHEILGAAAAVCGEEDPRFANVLTSLALTLLAEGRNEEAIEALQRALGIFSRRRGEGGEEAIHTLLTLGITYMEAGRRAEGLAIFERCTSQIDDLPGDASPRLALQLSAAWHGTREYRRAEELARRALGEDDSGRDGQREALARLGDALQGQGRLRDALAVREGAVAAASAALGETSAGLGHALADLALTLDALGDTARATAMLDRSVRLIHGLAHTDG
jgi:tetratricopeptide (TPR) repeat protein